MRLDLSAIGLLVLASVALFWQQKVESTSAECRIVTAADLADSKAPAFEDFAVAIRQAVLNPKVDLRTNAIAKRYRTVLRLEAARGPNYAGHYRVVVWGCGSSCAMFAVVNLKTGRVITPDGFAAVSGVHLEADGFLPNTKSEEWGFRYRSDSKLLVVIGDLDEDESREGAFYFLLKAEKLRPIYSTLVEKNCAEAKP